MNLKKLFIYFILFMCFKKRVNTKPIYILSSIRPSCIQSWRKRRANGLFSLTHVTLVGGVICLCSSTLFMCPSQAVETLDHVLRAALATHKTIPSSVLWVWWPCSCSLFSFLSFRFFMLFIWLGSSLFCFLRTGVCFCAGCLWGLLLLFFLASST